MSKKGKKVWERVYNERTSYLMLLPNIIMFAVFTVYPILWLSLIHISEPTRPY